ncbi:Phytocyanin domain-containing protein [Citrus sinensis]|nr:basic blue protein-like [Citrus sinensis]KAH9655133.1 Phytocyanin domain-containing protein [Citrus sinensis]
MEDQKVFRFYSFPIIILINYLFFTGIKSEVYTVGGDEQWNTGANFDSWSQQYNYSIGDVLVFKYTEGQHNVYEVTQATYRSCVASSGVIAKYESGNDQVTLTEAKKYWFICNVAGHCLGGMRFSIDVKEISNTNSTAAAAPTLPPEILEPSNSFVSFAFQRWNIVIYIITCVILLYT